MHRLILGVVFCALVVTATRFTAYPYYLNWRARQNAPNKASSSHSYRPLEQFEKYYCEVRRTDDGRYFYAIALAGVDFEPNQAAVEIISSYHKDTGRDLVINGKPIRYQPERRLLAPDPFGRLKEIVLNDHEADLVGKCKCEDIWHHVVIPRLYVFKGGLKNGKREGMWACFGEDGKKAYEGAFAEGLRHGKWTHYYPSGTPRAFLRYDKGRRAGKWDYFSPEGRIVDTLTWHGDEPVREKRIKAGLGR